MHPTTHSADVCTNTTHCEKADVAKAITALRKRLNRWELEHLRQHSTALANQLEQAEEEIERLKSELVYAWRTADSWREDIDGLFTALESTGQRVGLTKGGELVAVPTGDTTHQTGQQDEATDSALVNYLVASQAFQLAAVGSPVGGAGGGDAPIVVEVYTLRAGVPLVGEGGNLRSTQRTLELEAHGKVFVLDVLGAREAHGLVASVQCHIASIGLQVQAVDEEKLAELGNGVCHGHSLAKAAILTGPQGSGKSAIACELAKHLGLPLLVDEWRPDMVIVPGALHITNCEVPA